MKHRIAAAALAALMAGQSGAETLAACKVMGTAHPNGGGLVPMAAFDYESECVGLSDEECRVKVRESFNDYTRKSAIPDSVYVGPNSVVCADRGLAMFEISGNVVIRNSIVHGGDIQISDNVTIKNSTLGGFRSSYYGQIRISGNARIVDAHIGNGTVSGNAKILNGAEVYGNARVYGNAKVSGQGTRISGNAEVFGTAIVRDGAWIYGNGKVNKGRYTKNARIDTDETGVALNLGDMVSNLLNPENTQTSE